MVPGEWLPILLLWPARWLRMVYSGMERTQEHLRAARRLRIALGFGALVWLLLLAVGFVAPGGWKWGIAGPFGHMQNYLISFWFVLLVLTPLLATMHPLESTPVIQIYLLGIGAIIVSTFRNEPPEPLSDAVPLSAAALTAGLVAWAHPERGRLWRIWR